MVSVILAGIIAITALLITPAIYLGAVQHVVTSATGYRLDLSNPQVDLFPPRLAVRDLRVANPSAPNDSLLVAIDALEVTASLTRYLSAEPTWWNATASSALVRIENVSGGRTNWHQPEAQKRDSLQATQEASSAEGNRMTDTGSRFRFSSIAISDLELIRVVDTDTVRVEVSNLLIEKDSDERLRINVEGNVEEQPLKASGTLALPSSDKAHRLDFQAALLGLHVSLTGTVGHDGVTPGEATFDLRMENSRTLERLLDLNLETVTPIELNGHLSAPGSGRWTIDITGDIGGRKLSLNLDATGAGSAYEVEKLGLKFGASDLQVQGRINASERSAAATVTSQTLDVDELRSLVALKNPARNADDTRPSSATFEVLSQWTIDVDASAGRIRYRGYEARNAKLNLTSNAKGVNSTIELAAIPAPDTGMEISNTTATSTDAESTAGKSAWRLVTPTYVNVQMPFGQANEIGRPLRAKIQTEGIRAEIDTVFSPGLSSLPSTQFVLHIENAKSLAGKSFERWTQFLPIDVNAQLTARESALLLAPLTLAISGYKLDGEIAVDMSQTPIAFDGHLQSPEIDLNNIPATPLDEAQEIGEEIDAEHGDIIGSDSIDWTVLDTATVNLGLTIERLRFNQTDFRNFRSQLVLSEGQFALDPFDASLSTGRVRGHAHAERHDDGGSVSARLMVTGLTPADLGQQNAGLIDGGSTDLLVDIQASGNSPKALASDLTGELALEIQHATVRNNLFEIIGSDVLMQMVDLLNPFSEKTNSTELACAAAYFRAEGGVLTSPDQLVIETDRLKIRGGGHIDLADETLQIDFVPRPREGLGISFGRLASVVRLGGTLGNPQPEADPAGIFKAGATIGAAVATGGLSFLGQGLFDRMRSAGTDCGRIFETVPEDRPDREPDA